MSRSTKGAKAAGDASGRTYGEFDNPVDIRVRYGYLDSSRVRGLGRCAVRLHDTYHAICLCGHEIETTELAGICRHCAGHFEIQWRTAQPLKMQRASSQIAAENNRLIAKAEKREKITRIRERLGMTA